MFYVYVLLDPRKPGDFTYGNRSFKFQPFYVGKGSGRRLTTTVVGAKNMKGAVLAKIEAAGLKVKIKTISNLTEERAYELEGKLIALIGRKCAGEGPLSNLAIGGGSASGWKQSDETRDHLMRANLGKKHTEATKAKLKLRPVQLQSDETKEKRAAKHRGMKRSETTKALISMGQMGKVLSAEHRAKIAKANKGKVMSDEQRQKIRDGMAAARARGIRIGGRNGHTN